MPDVPLTVLTGMGIDSFMAIYSVQARLLSVHHND